MVAQSRLDLILIEGERPGLVCIDHNLARAETADADAGSDAGALLNRTREDHQAVVRFVHVDDVINGDLVGGQCDRWRLGINAQGIGIRGSNIAGLVGDRDNHIFGCTVADICDVGLAQRQAPAYAV